MCVDGDEFDLIDNMLCGASKTRAVIGANKIVIDGLRNADNADSFGRKALGKFVASIHRIVAAIWQDDGNIVLLQSFFYLIPNFFVIFVEFETGRPKHDSGGLGKQRNGFLVQRGKRNQIIVDKPLDAVERSIDLTNGILFLFSAL